MSHGYLRSGVIIYLIHEISPERKKKLLSTSFLADIQATDSTCIGWTAKTAATMKETIRSFLNRRYIRIKTSRVFRACRIIFPAIKGRGEIPS